MCKQTEDAERAEEAKVTREEGSNELNDSRPLILVADDEAVLRESIRYLLKDYFRIVEASNGLEALEAYEKHRPDVVLMDIMMPFMNGIEATREILKRDPDAIILAISAYSDKKGKEILEVGAKAILPKPFRRRELVEFIMKHINDGHATP